MHSVVDVNLFRRTLIDLKLQVVALDRAVCIDDGQLVGSRLRYGNVIELQLAAGSPSPVPFIEMA